MSKATAKSGKKENVPRGTKRGRPSKYTDEIVEEICRRVAKGESLRQIGMVEGLPCTETIREWTHSNKDFTARYAHAKALMVDHFEEEIREIAHDGRNDWEVIESERTGQERIVLNAEAVQRSRLRVDTLKWLMSKLAPKKYGDKIEVDNKVTMQPYTEIGGDAN